RLQQSVVFMLSVDMHQRAACLGEHIERTEAAVQINTIFPRTAEYPFDDELITDFEPRLAEQGLNRRRQIVEQGFHRRLILAVANDVSSAALARDQPERIENDRLARAGFAGEDVETRLEFQNNLIDNGKILDAKFAQHDAFGLALSPLELVPQDFVVA